MRVTEWLKQSNRWKHLLGGFILGIVPPDCITGLYGGAVAASALEFKDKSYGSKWDWIDRSVTVIGSILGCSLRFLIMEWT